MNVQNPPAAKIMPDAQVVTSVRHWTDTLFSFRVKRPQSLRFRSGEFVMIGLLKDNGKPLLRAYSIASPSWASNARISCSAGGPGLSRAALRSCAVVS